MINSRLASVKVKAAYAANGVRAPAKVHSVAEAVNDWCTTNGTRGKASLWKADSWAFPSYYLPNGEGLYSSLQAPNREKFFTPSGFQCLWAEVALMFYGHLWATAADINYERVLKKDITTSVDTFTANVVEVHKNISEWRRRHDFINKIRQNGEATYYPGDDPLGGRSTESIKKSEIPGMLEKVNAALKRTRAALAALSTTVGDVMALLELPEGPNRDLLRADLTRLYSSDSVMAGIQGIDSPYIISQFNGYQTPGMSGDYYKLFGEVEKKDDLDWPLYVFENTRPPYYGLSTDRVNVVSIKSYDGSVSSSVPVTKAAFDELGATYSFKTPKSVPVKMTANACVLYGAITRSVKVLEPLEGIPEDEVVSNDADTKEDAKEDVEPGVDARAVPSSNATPASADAERAVPDKPVPEDWVDRVVRAREDAKQRDESLGQEVDGAEDEYEEKLKWGDYVAIAGLSAAALLLLLWLLGVPQAVCADLCRKGILPKLTGRIGQCGSLLHWKSPHPIYDDDGHSPLSSELLYDTLALSRKVSIQGGGEYKVEDYDARKVFHLQLSGMKGHFFVRSHVSIGDKIFYKAYNPYYNLYVLFWPWPVDHQRDYESFF